MSVNDAAVNKAWAESQGTVGSLLTIYADTRSEVTEALDLVMDHPGPRAVLGNKRCKRFSLYVEDCKVRLKNVAATEKDPAGDDFPEVTLVEKMLEDLRARRDEL